MTQRVKRICSIDSIEEELKIVEGVFRQNGYPSRFIAKNMAERPPKPSVATVEKKRIFIRVPFQRDGPSELLRRRLS